MSQEPSGLVPGQKLGPYELLELIGQGGMGQVYRAVDTRLKRAVAIKVMPPSVRNDGERLARFRREAELLAALNHPNIAHIYGVEEAGGEMAIVMELAEGQTLAERIAAGALPTDEALPIARQILDALDAAHDRGIIHRDLKPANVKVGHDGTVKVLDFGLAKALITDGDASRPGEPGSSSRLADSPTLTAHATQMGMILGTAAYMAPEQAKGRVVDRRADLWAFGCVLYEMVSGTRAFGGDDVTDTLANVLKTDADMRALPGAVPPRVRSVISACLQKDPKQRLASAQDARLVLDGALGSEPSLPAAPPHAPVVPAWRRALPYGVGALVAAIAVSLVAWRYAPAPEPSVVNRFAVDIPVGQELRSIGRSVVAISPDGRSFVYNANGGLRFRAMGELEARIIPGTEAASVGPVFSPNSQHVAFVAAGEIKRIAVTGGAIQSLAKLTSNPLGLHWSEAGVILMAVVGGIARVSDTGGTPELIVQTAADEQAAMPQLLPGGDAVLFTVRNLKVDDWDKAQIVVHSLRTGKRTKLLEGARDARYLPTGHLVYAIEDDLFAVAFDPADFTTRGGAAPLVQGVWWREIPSANWGVSTTGTLIYIPNIPPDAIRPVWVSRQGAITPIDNLPGGEAPRLSPDGKQMLVEIDHDVWIYDIATGRQTRVTTGGNSGRPAWQPTGQYIAFSSSRSGSEGAGRFPVEEVWVVPVDGSSAPRKLTELPSAVHVDSWSPDGRSLAFHHHSDGARPQEILQIQPGDPSSKVSPLVQREANSEGAVFSPDGRYIAYHSSETGQREVYVRAFPGPGPQVTVSVGGGREVLWARTGEIFYRTPTGGMMAVKVTTTPTLSVGTPTPLFEGNFHMTPRSGSPRPQFDVTRDGQRFLMLRVDRSVSPQIVVVQNWFEDLKRLVTR